MSPEVRTGTTTGSTHTRTANRTGTHTITETTSAPATYVMRRGLVSTGAALRAGWRRLMQETTATTWVAAATVAGGLLLGQWGWTAGWVLAALAGVLLLLAVPFVVGRSDYRAHLEVDHDFVVAGNPIHAQLEVYNRRSRNARAASLDLPIGDGLVEAWVPVLPPAGTSKQSIDLGTHPRSVLKVGPMSFVRSDPLRLLQRSYRWAQVESVFVHPRTVIIGSTSAGAIHDLEGSPTNEFAVDDLAFHAIRDYSPGDSQRHIHWKSVAKTGQLMVRQYERTQRSHTAVLLHTETGAYIPSEDELETGNAAFELAVSMAASVAVQSIRDGRDVTFALSGEIPEYLHGKVRSVSTLPTMTARTLLDASCDIRMSSTAISLNDLTSLTAQAVPDLSIAFLSTSASTPLASLRAAALSIPSRVKLVAMIASPLADPGVQRFDRLAVLTVGDLKDLPFLVHSAVTP